MEKIERLIDLLLAISMLVICSPVLLFVLVVTKIHLNCNVTFADLRVGKDGKVFKMYKITTMKPTPENLALRKLGPIQKNDPRISRFSMFLRRYSIDELPQLINVIKGDMSLVGPRPEFVHLSKDYSNQLVGYDRRLLVLPGMTGLAQINGFRKSHIESEKRLAHDIFYIEHKNLWLYFLILIKTPWAVVHYEVW